MSSYISTVSISSSLRQSILKLQSGLAQGQAELATGNHADIGLSLGAETGKSVSLQSENAFLRTVFDANSAVSARLSATQNHLADLQASAQNMLDALLASDGSSTGATALQTAATDGLKSFTSVLNSALNGDQLFAGINTGVAPITNYYGSSASNKQAVDSIFSAAFGVPQSSAAVSGISGSAMQTFLDTQFSTLFQGANWASDWSTASDQTLTNEVAPNRTENTSVSANQPALQKLAQAYVMVADLGTQNLGQGALQALVSTARTTLTSAISGLTSMQASLGLVQASVSTADAQMSLQMDLLSTQISNLESVNTYEATTRVSELQTQIETSYSLTSQLQQLSLVKFL